MDKKNTEKCKKVKNRFVVMGVRHFENGEHHWIAFDGKEEENRIEAEAFADDGTVEVNEYDKPVFSSLGDAERFAMSKVHGEYTLAQWETRRPTMYIVEEESYIAIVERDDHDLPIVSERWSDAKVADFERMCDCEDIAFLAVWDSDTDEERVSESSLFAARRLDAIDGMSAWVTSEGLVGVEDAEYTIEGIRDFVDNMNGEGALGCESIEFVKSEGNTAFFKVN